MKIGQRLLARLSAQQYTLCGESFYTEAKEIHVYVASMVGDRLKVADQSGLLFPDEFILADGVWRSTHGWYIQQDLPVVLYCGRALAALSA